MGAMFHHEGFVACSYRGTTVRIVLYSVDLAFQRLPLPELSRKAVSGAGNAQ